MPQCNADTFQLFINEFARQYEHQFNIMVLDNGAFHKAKSLKIPPNMALLFLTPYSPELNPAEKIWQLLKKKFSNKLLKTLDDISDFISEHSKILVPDRIKATCNYDYIFSDIIWTT